MSVRIIGLEEAVEVMVAVDFETINPHPIKRRTVSPVNTGHIDLPMSRPSDRSHSLAGKMMDLYARIPFQLPNVWKTNTPP